MNRNLFLRLSGLIILLAMAGCGQKTPAPVLLSNAELTSIAGTARAAIQQTRQAYTPTPIPPTSTPQVSPISGTSLIVREDRTALFIDHRAGIQLIIPEGWLPIRLNEDEYYKAFTLDVVLSNPDINSHLTAIQDIDMNKFRLDAIDIRDGHTPGGIVSYMNVIFQEDDTRSLEEWLKAERAQKKPFKGYKFLSSKYPETADGTRVLVIEESWGSGSLITYYRGVFFNLPTGTVVLDFYANLDFKDTVLPDFEQVVNSLGPINP